MRLSETLPLSSIEKIVSRNLDQPLAIGVPYLFPVLILLVDSGQCMAKLRDLSEK